MVMVIHTLLGLFPCWAGIIWNVSSIAVLCWARRLEAFERMNLSSLTFFFVGGLGCEVVVGW